jgi:hypothetical protein
MIDFSTLSIVLLLIKAMFRRLDALSVLRYKTYYIGPHRLSYSSSPDEESCAQQIELFPIFDNR